MSRSRSISIMLVVILVSYPNPIDVMGFQTNDIQTSGVYIDEVLYPILELDDSKILALENGEIDLISEQLDWVYLETLENKENIEVVGIPRNGYGYLSINTQRYPFNISAFRRALAFAIDKIRISEEAWQSYSSPIDSTIPLSNPWSIETELPGSYYDAEVDIGNSLLDEAGFLDVDIDEYREAPNGSDFSVGVFMITYNGSILSDTGYVVVDALQNLDIDVYPIHWNYFSSPDHFWLRKDYDVALLGSRDFQLNYQGARDFRLNNLFSEFHSEYADTPYLNMPGYINSTFDGLILSLNSSKSADEVQAVSAEIQELLYYECPIIPLYDNFLFYAYRNDTFSNIPLDPIYGVAGWWTPFLTRQVNPPPGGTIWGGTLRWALNWHPETFNIMKSTTLYESFVLGQLYDSLLKRNPSGMYVPWLAESYTVEYHEDNPGVPEGKTRITFSIVRNATWTNGVSITGESIAYALNYYRDAQGNQLGSGLADATSIYSPTLYSLVMQYNSESYWHLFNVAEIPILPQELLSELGYTGWEDWNPTPPDDEMITSGPFIVSDFVPGEYVSLVRNPEYFRALDRTISPVTTTESTTISTTHSNTLTTTIISSTIPSTSTTSTTFTTSTGEPTDTPNFTSFLGIDLIHWIVTLPSVIIIIVVISKWGLERQQIPTASSKT
ncbi:MAG: ABC transporter substrate-binding protein [Candidatus Thorarchaeota archaeon]